MYFIIATIARSGDQKLPTSDPAANVGGVISAMLGNSGGLGHGSWSCGGSSGISASGGIVLDPDGSALILVPWSSLRALIAPMLP